MMQDCASNNKIKKDKYKILRMSLLLGSDEDREETINNFEDAAREIDTMNDEIYLKDLEDKFYDTKDLESEEKKLAVLVDYIGGRVEQRISLLSDFANVTGFDLMNLPPIKYYDKLDGYKERLEYIREYLKNITEINSLNNEIELSEKKLKEAYLNKATSEESNARNEEILLNKFKNAIRTIKEFAEIDEINIDEKLNQAIANTIESKKSLDIFTKSFTTLNGSGISYDEEQEYRSYVENAKQVYYANKEQEYLLQIYKYLFQKEQEYGQILLKRETINSILYERLDLRKELNITESDILSNLYDILERQYEDIKKQQNNIESIELLTESITSKKEQVNELEIENQKVEILALLREYGIIDTYSELTEPNEPKEEIVEEPIQKNEEVAKEDIFSNNLEQTFEIPTVDTTPELPDIFNTNITESPKEEPEQEVVEEPAQDNEIIKVESATTIDLELVHAKANKVMKRVGDMLGIKTEETKIVSVTNEELPVQEEKKEEIKSPFDEPSEPINPLFNTDINPTEEPKTEIKEENKIDTTTSPFMNEEENNFWFPSETPDALNELPDLEVTNNNLFENNDISNLNFPDLKINFDSNDSEVG